jgi:uncharacterized protein (DUF924 family)
MSDPNPSTGPQSSDEATRTEPTAALLDELLTWWFGTPGPAPDTAFRGAWFARDDAFDAELRERFGRLAARAATEPDAFFAWRRDARGALGLMLLLDQCPRNLHRGTAAAFAADALAREVATEVVDAGLDQQVPFICRTFIYLPFEHSEHIEDQHRAVALFERLLADGKDAAAAGHLTAKHLEGLHMIADYARKHLDVIEKFGRFPHRNAALGRETSADERAYLEGGGGF